ncbi:sigma-54-dependent Fis family transcriptional regulator [Alkalilimnicola sp. S0819]|uniref:sigma-54-dependent Fis family transcriptional regulator n=1 Tax=Alkalilimnicola sp. S0819 TaxID=2613922 RepID=UPI001261E17F|nr:sigma-54-dependent Fis family transcriptional regulator [Alkalilimnicola sp. S0819]KAB7627380.1 AAA domain-containing protein [Alkalilimnicola sp. S0819]MPQ16099.1 AAA domain-containing protein [Alkalilimnicola sp. S0819]
MSGAPVPKNFDQLFEQLKLRFEHGRILLEKQRMVLLHTGAIAALRKELVESLGLDRARGVLTRMGYASGQRDAQMCRRMIPNASDEELMHLGPALHSLEGVVEVEPAELDIDITAGRYYGEFIWRNSFEADVHLETFGLDVDPVCWIQIGYASGYTSAVMGRFIMYRETECRGRGDKRCYIIGKPAEDWADAERDLKYYRPDRVADQLIALQTQVEQLRYNIDEQLGLGDMVGTSEAFKDAAEMVAKAARSQITVLLLGETGVGKEMFARALHGLSARAEKAFVPINCAAIPEELIESELFGVEKGAFTGAAQSRPGRFERAHGGTLFLDEVGELSPAAQAKLLRVLQEGEFERVGDTQTRRVDVRLVAATNVELAQAVEAGRFRADLYYRLNIYPVLLPPLRDRREDIPLLALRFLDKHTARHGKSVRGVSSAALTALQQYPWPGNIRELQNMIERGVIIAPPGGEIEVEHLFSTLHPPPAQAAEPEPSEPLDSLVDQALGRETSLEELELRLMEAAVEKAEGNLSSAARMLGLTRPQLAYRLKKHGRHM